MTVSLSKYQLLVALLCAAAVIISTACGDSDDSGAAVSPTAAAGSGEAAGSDKQVFIRLEDPLDEPEFYCLDIPGQGTAINLGDEIQVHTCKSLELADDQLFTMDYPAKGQIYMEAYGLCVETPKAIADMALFLQECSESPLQRFVYDSNGRLLLDVSSGPPLCLAVEPGLGTATGGPSHLRRGLNLQDCDNVAASLTRWQLDDSENPSIPRGFE